MKKVKRIALYIALLAAVIGGIALTCFNDHTYEITVTDKERTVHKKTSKYLVFAEDDSGETLVFENTDELIRGKFDSSTVQGRLKEGGRYRITVIGYRVPLLSMYENIIYVQEIG